MPNSNLGDEKLHELTKIAVVLKSVAHPIRLAIIELLKEGDKKTVTEIHESLETHQAVTSQHLILLKDKGILSSEKIGKNIYYYLRLQETPQIIAKLQQNIEELV